MKPQIMLGTFQNDQYKDLLNVVDKAFSMKCYAFDTAPSYGTEVDLGKAILECQKRYNVSREQIYLSDKVDAWQMMNGDGDIKPYVEKALSKMKVDYLDILWVHWPISEYIVNTWKSIETCKREGLIKDAGICNVRVRHLKDLCSKGIKPQNIQIERSPLRVCQDELDYCKQNGINIFSYSPMCRMHQDLRNSTLLRDIAKKYEKDIGQIILRWHIDTNATPIFMSKKPSRVADNLDVFAFHLNEDEIRGISKSNQNYKIFLESWGCPGF